MKPSTDARMVAAQLWPGPDPVDFCKREAIAQLVAFDANLASVRVLRGRMYSSLFPDLMRLWIHPTPSEEVLVELRAELRRALATATEAADFLTAARSENELRFYEQRISERVERGVL